MKKKKSPVLSEKETREKLFTLAKRMGCDNELRQIFTRYDGLLKNCQNESEKKHIIILANVEVHKLFGFRNPLIVDGQEIIPADPTWTEEQKYSLTLGGLKNNQ